MNRATLDIVLPCYNPVHGWEDRVLETIKNLVSTLSHLSINVIIVDDGSQQRIHEGLNKFEQLGNYSILKSNINFGKGHAVRLGATLSTAEFLVYTDVDFPYTLDSLIDVINAITSEAFDVVIGIRDKNYYQQIPSERKKISLLLRNINKRFMKLVTDDTQCGLKAVSSSGKELLLKTKLNRYLFDLEFIKLLSKQQSLRYKLQNVTLGESVKFSKIPISKLMGELVDYLTILFFR